MGTNGSEIANRVAEQLRYNMYDTEAIENTAREMGFLEDVKKIDEVAPSLFERLFSHRPEIHLHRLHSVIYELASRGNAVILGRGSHVLLRPLTPALHIRVIASVEKRIRNLMERGYQREAAVKILQKSDHERGAFVKFAFGVDWDNPELYDITLNMDNLSVGLAVDMIVSVAHTEEIKARSIDAIRSLEMMGLARRAEAAIMEAGFSLSSLSVSVAKPGNVQLSGALDQVDKARLEEALQHVKGIESVDDQIKVIQRDITASRSGV